MADSRWSPAVGAVAFDGLLGSDLIFTAAGPVIRTQNNEDLTLLPNGTGITVVGDAGSTSHGFNTNDDAFIAGRLEVDSFTYFDSPSHHFPAAGGAIFLGGVGAATECALEWTKTIDHLAFYVGSEFGRALNVGDMAWRGKNFDHGLQATPRLSVHGVDPDTDNTAYSSMQYQQSLFGAGKGAFLGIKSITEEVTIPVGQGAAGVITAGNLAPANSRIIEAAVRVTQQPGGGATTLDAGITGGNLDGLIDGIATAVDTTGNSVANNDGVQTFPIENAAATTLTLTTDANVTGTDMTVRVVVWYRDVVAPTS